MTLSDAGALDLTDNLAAPRQPAPLTRWFAAGLRASFFLPPKLQGAEPKPWQVLVLVLLISAIGLALERLQVKGAALFDVQAWLSGWWTVLLFLVLAWWAMPVQVERSEQTASKPLSRVAPLVSICLVWMLAELPATLVFEVYSIALAHELIHLPTSWGTWVYWVAYVAFFVWTIGVNIFVLIHFFGRSQKTAVFALCLIASMALTVTQFNARSWQEDYTKRSGDEAEKPRLHLTQQVFEEQQALLKEAMARIAPQRKDRAEVYGLVFAPYAAEDVFLRESTMVATVLRERFDAGDRTIHLLNHGSTAKTHPWATTPNLEQAVQALANKMDLEQDLLVVYLTSHGGSDFKLAATHWPLEIEALTPQLLKQILDKAGVRNRVIAVSACYAGGWADVLATEHSLIMTAADATHTSYGCGSRSELTFFGRAVFDEQLRKTHSFEQAFNRAVPIIKQREIEGDKKDGFSNPQIRIGSQIRPLLKALEQRLERLVPIAAS